MEAEQEEGLEGNAASVRVRGRDVGDGEMWSASSESSCAFMIPCDARRTIEWFIELVQSG